MQGTITAIRFQKRTADRVNLYLDGKYAFSLPAVEAAGLAKGQTLSAREVQALQQLDRRARAHDRALRFLARRPRSVWEVEQYLRRVGKGGPQPARGKDQAGVDGPASRPGLILTDDDIRQVLQRLAEQGYLDDEAFARFWIEQRNRFKPMAPRALRYELRRKGIEDAVLRRVLQEDALAPETAALQAARGRAERWSRLEEAQFRAKMGAFLARRGFGWEVVRSVVEHLWQELAADSATSE